MCGALKALWRAAGFQWLRRPRRYGLPRSLCSRRPGRHAIRLRARLLPPRLPAGHHRLGRVPRRCIPHILPARLLRRDTLPRRTRPSCGRPLPAAARACRGPRSLRSQARSGRRRPSRRRRPRTARDSDPLHLRGALPPCRPQSSGASLRRRSVAIPPGRLRDPMVPLLIIPPQLLVCVSRLPLSHGRLPRPGRRSLTNPM